MWFMPLDSLEILFYFKSYLTVSQHPNGWMGKLKNFCYVLCYYFNKCIIPSINIPSIIPSIVKYSPLTARHIGKT